MRKDESSMQATDASQIQEEKSSLPMYSHSNSLTISVF